MRKKNKHTFSGLFLIMIVCTLEAHSQVQSEPPPTVLSFDSVIRKVINQSLEYKKIKASKMAQLSYIVQAEAPFDWQLFSTIRFHSREQNTLYIFENPSQESWDWLMGVEKKLSTGTQLKIKSSYLYTDKTFSQEHKRLFTQNPSSDQSRFIRTPDTTARNALSLEIEQDLLRNIFGYEDRYRLQIARENLNRSQIQLKEKVEDLIIRATKQFWNTYLSEFSLNLKKSEKQDYQELTRLARKKHIYGYLRPGELNQIQAELERTKQEVVLQELHYNDQLTRIVTLLEMGLQDLNKLKLQIDKDIPPPPSFNKVLNKTPRRVELAQKNLLILEKELQIQKSQLLPTLKLFGSYGIDGYDTGPSSAWENLKTGKNHNYYLGVKFRYSIPNTKIRRDRIFVSEQAVEAGRWELKIAQKEFDRSLLIAKKHLHTLYQVIKNSKKIRRLRTRSYNEIRKAYSQGQLSIFDLISARKSALQSEMKTISLMAQYYELLAYNHALTDTLIGLYMK